MKKKRYEKEDDEYLAYMRRQQLSQETASIMSRSDDPLARLRAAQRLLEFFYFERSAMSAGKKTHPDFLTYAGDFMQANANHPDIARRLGGAQVVGELLQTYPPKCEQNMQFGYSYWCWN